MNTTMINTKDVILALKRVKKEKKLSLDKILILMNEKDSTTAVSKTTLARVFRDGSEDEIFRYEATLRPIANALLDIEQIEAGDSIDTQALKSILILKQELITALDEKLHKTESHDAPYYQRELEHYRTQIALKDKRIDQLLDANDRLQRNVDKLTDQLLSCPCRANDKIGG